MSSYVITGAARGLGVCVGFPYKVIRVTLFKQLLTERVYSLAGFPHLYVKIRLLAMETPTPETFNENERP
jgi:hypothetical protein